MLVIKFDRITQAAQSAVVYDEPTAARFLS